MNHASRGALDGMAIVSFRDPVNEALHRPEQEIGNSRQGGLS
jgi:hypothetical protein